MGEEIKSFCVYCHVFPNGKRYIGITSDKENRWRNGHGYKSQNKVWAAIQKYGWDNIAHKILIDGLTREQAIEAEKQLIEEFDSIRNGYNVSMGGDDFNATYLSGYVLSLIRGVKRYYDCQTIADIAYSDRYNRDASEFWNEASDAVTAKHGKLSSTDEIDVARFWWYMGQYVDLWLKIEKGEDVSNWREMEFEQALFLSLNVISPM